MSIIVAAITSGMKYGGYFLEFEAFGLGDVGGVGGVLVAELGDAADDEFAA